jgi:hypothetical protein
MVEAITNSLNTVVANASTMQLNFFGGLIIAVGIIGFAAVLNVINNKSKG